MRTRMRGMLHSVQSTLHAARMHVWEAALGVRPAQAAWLGLIWAVGYRYTNHAHAGHAGVRSCAAELGRRFLRVPVLALPLNRR
jgi:hypothetical protein